jgi:hypothetical protein
MVSRLKERVNNDKSSIRNITQPHLSYTTNIFRLVQQAVGLEESKRAGCAPFHLLSISIA